MVELGYGCLRANSAETLVGAPQKRRMLAEQLRQLENLLGQLQALEQELQTEQELAQAMPTEAGLLYGAYAAHAIERRENILRRIMEQQKAVEEAREDLRDAFLEFKKYEIAEEQRAIKIEAELAREEQAILDEIGLVTYIRKG